MSVLQRIERLEKKQNTEFDEIRGLISAGTFFDELDERQKKEYIAYRESLGGVADDIAGAKLEEAFFGASKEGAYHFLISERKPAVTREELQERIDEIEQYMNQKKAENERVE